MCGRFTLTEVDADLVIEQFGLDGVPEWPPRYNIAPTQPVATVLYDAETRHNELVLMHWGLIPSWSKDPSIGSRMINARGETVHEKPSFRSALRRRRCLVLADGFYEWQKQADGSKIPQYITLHDHALFAFAGLYEFWTDRESGGTVTTCTIITTTANELIANVHDRMPVILPREDYASWLNPAHTDPADVMPYLRPFPADEMTYYPVSRAVNNPRNDSPELIERVG